MYCKGNVGALLIVCQICRYTALFKHETLCRFTKQKGIAASMQYCWNKKHFEDL
jgi:hypothetical protein